MRHLSNWIVVLAFSALGYFAWQQRTERIKADGRAEVAENKLGIAATRLIKESFTAQGDFRVARLTGKVSTPSRTEGIFFDVTQTTTAPYAVNYFVDLSKVHDEAIEFDDSKKQVTIRIPDVTIETPSIDMENADIKQKGVIIFRGEAVRLSKRGAAQSRIFAEGRARESRRLNDAREAGRRQISQLASGMYRAVGQNMSVVVLYPWEGRKLDGQWDRSKSLSEIHSK